MKVSVIVASYGHERFLRQCIESVLNQTYRDFELLILDDRSPDGSLEIARSYETDPRVKVVLNEKNMGTYATENAGLELATGDLCAILNSDDYWHPEKLEKQVALLQKYHEVSFCYTLGDVVDENGKVMPGFDQHAGWPTSEHHDVMPYLLNVNQILASSLVFRKGAVKFNPTYRYCGDWIAAAQLARESWACFVNTPLTCWRQHGTNSSKLLLKTLPEEIKVRLWLISMWGGLRTHADNFLLRRKMCLSALDLGAHLTLVGDVRGARRANAKALLFNPFSLTAWKRLGGTYMDQNQVRARLWPGIDPAPFLDIFQKLKDSPN